MKFSFFQKNRGVKEKQLKLYKKFVDGMVSRSEGVLGRWVLERGAWPDMPENKVINEFLQKLGRHDKEVLAGLLEQARDDGIHDSLVYLYDKMTLDGLKLIEKGVELPQDPFGTELYFDWVARREGDPWPDESKD
ncbi:MAG: hypothetical protein F6K39_02085 [Okeania sp. SIO3B3]|nr:hypothetical protein [Okeania sp. SIO3B3]